MTSKSTNGANGHTNGHGDGRPFWEDGYFSAIWHPDEIDEYEPGAFEPEEIFEQRQEPRKGPAPLLPPDALRYPTDGSEAAAVDDDYVVKGLIAIGTAGTIVGPSGAGKTTVVVDIAFHIALEKDYHGRRVKQRPVLYVGYEGIPGLDNRIAAAVRKYGNPGKQFARLTISPSLNKTAEGDKGAKQIIAAARLLMREAEAEDGCVIIIDTKARATAGDDEDKATDTTYFLEHRIAVILREVKSAVAIVHHTGKETDRGGRGSSAYQRATIGDC